MKALKKLFRIVERRVSLSRLSPDTEIHWRRYDEDPPMAGCYVGLGNDGKPGSLVQGYNLCRFHNRFHDKPEFWAEIPVVEREFHLRDRVCSNIKSRLIWRTTRRPNDTSSNHFLLYKEESGARIVLWPGSEPFDEDMLIAWAECPSL